MSERTQRLSEEREARRCECKICGWVWYKRKGTEHPNVCPSCKNTGWDMGRMRAERKQKATDNE